MAVFFVSMATATFYLVLDVVFEGIEERIWFRLFFVFFSTVSVHHVYLLIFFRENKIKDIKTTNDVIALLMLSNL